MAGISGVQMGRGATFHHPDRYAGRDRSGDACAPHTAFLGQPHKCPRTAPRMQWSRRRRSKAWPGPRPDACWVKSVNAPDETLGANLGSLRMPTGAWADSDHYTSVRMWTPGEAVISAPRVGSATACVR